MAFYEGFAPNNTIFTVAEDGSIAFADGFTGVHALFTLPLDPSKADPAAADAFLAANDMGWTNERTPVEDEFETKTVEDADGNQTVIIRPKDDSPAPSAG